MDTLQHVPKNSRIVVGLSGGVDSSVTAKLLVDQGFEVIGIFMKNWDDANDPHCPAAEDAMDARSVAKSLGIPFYTVNFSKQYWEDVFEYFLEQHRKNRTPNPDILCNKYVKFKCFLDHAMELGADFIATGHYAGNYRNEETGKFELRCAKDVNKDQTYFLYTLNQAQLSKSLFPLADFEKSEIRKIAEEAGFVTAKKKDSVGICMVGDRDHMEFLQQYLSKTPGNFVTKSGDIVGQHVGLSFYTLGQRKNLNIGGVKGYPEKPWFVLKKNVEENEIMVGQDGEDAMLMMKTLWAEKVDWVEGDFWENIGDFISCKAKIRYRQEGQSCKIFPEISSEKVRVEFDVPQRAVTSGQSVVFYDDSDRICLGGAEIV